MLLVVTGYIKELIMLLVVTGHTKELMMLLVVTGIDDVTGCDWN